MRSEADGCQTEAEPWHTGGVMHEILASIRSARWFWPACLVLHVATRLGLLLAAPIVQTSDFRWYQDSAASIATGIGYVKDGMPTAFWPVGWPGFLGGLFRLFGPAPLVGQLANLALSCIVLALTAGIAQRISRDPLVPRLACLFLALYPNQIAYVPVLSCEIFYQPLLLGGIALSLGGTLITSIAAGIVFGVAGLTKTQTLLLPLVLLVAIGLASRPKPALRAWLMRAAVLHLAMAATIAPWTARNWVVLDAFVPVSTNGGFTLLTGNNPSATGNYNATDPLVTSLSRDPRQEVETDRLARRRALDWIAENSGRFLTLLPLKFLRLWAHDGEAEWWYQAGFAAYDAWSGWFHTGRWVNQVYYWTLLALALYSLRGGVWGRPPIVALWVPIGLTTLLSLVFSGQSRFHFTLMPAVAILAALGSVALGVRRFGTGTGHRRTRQEQGQRHGQIEGAGHQQ